MFGFLFVVLIWRLNSLKLLSAAIDGGHVFFSAKPFLAWIIQRRRIEIFTIRIEIADKDNSEPKKISTLKKILRVQNMMAKLELINFVFFPSKN